MNPNLNLLSLNLLRKLRQQQLLSVVTLVVAGVILVGTLLLLGRSLRPLAVAHVHAQQVARADVVHDVVAKRVTMVAVPASVVGAVSETTHRVVGVAGQVHVFKEVRVPHASVVRDVVRHRQVSHVEAGVVA